MILDICFWEKLLLYSFITAILTTFHIKFFLKADLLQRCGFEQKLLNDGCLIAVGSGKGCIPAHIFPSLLSAFIDAIARIANAGAIPWNVSFKPGANPHAPDAFKHVA